jgi:hypothetical protein
MMVPLLTPIRLLLRQNRFRSADCLKNNFRVRILQSRKISAHVLIDAKATLGELQAGQERAPQDEEHLDANRLPKRTRTGAA